MDQHYYYCGHNLKIHIVMDSPFENSTSVEQRSALGFLPPEDVKPANI